jgi:hypothetical protein
MACDQRRGGERLAAAAEGINPTSAMTAAPRATPS